MFTLLAETGSLKHMDNEDIRTDIVYTLQYTIQYDFMILYAFKTVDINKLNNNVQGGINLLK